MKLGRLTITREIYPEMFWGVTPTIWADGGDGLLIGWLCWTLEIDKNPAPNKDGE